MKKSAVILTGCAGFIGSNLCDFLIKKKQIIIGLDNLILGKKKILKIY